MAITISGENNNDKILASDGVIDQISGINIVGVITATSFTGDLTGNVTGNLTGNVNSTSPLLLQTGGSERFRITGNNELGIAGANYGSSGQVLTSGGSDSSPTWSTITETTINNNADNRIITGSGTANTLNGEANLTFNGNTLSVTGSKNLYGNGAASAVWGNTGYTGHLTYDGSDNAVIRAASGKALIFQTNHTNERLRIASDGVITAYEQLILSNALPSLKLIDSANSHYAYLDGNSGNLVLHSDKGNTHSSSTLKLAVDNSVKVTVDSSGDLEINDGDLKVASGHGIDFSATSDGSGTTSSEILDEYEEGYYTPTATTGAGGNITGTTSFSLRYVKIGGLVHLFGRLHFSVSAFNVTSFSLSLPFTNSTANRHDTSSVMHLIRGNGGDPVQGIRIFRVAPGGTTMSMQNHEGQSDGYLGNSNPHLNVNFSYFSA